MSAERAHEFADQDAPRRYVLRHEPAAPVVRISGVLQAGTLITNSVISSSYTPGAGNVA